MDDGVRQGNMRADARQAMNPQDVNDLREMMAAITGDEKFVDEKFKQHYRMKAQIVDFFDKRHLTNVSGWWLLCVCLHGVMSAVYSEPLASCAITCPLY